jgi:hypothetical protein
LNYKKGLEPEIDCHITLISTTYPRWMWGTWKGKSRVTT